MISFEDAKRIAAAHIGPDCGLIESETIEKPYGWYFLGQSRAFLASGNIEDMLFGSGGFLVERAGGRVVAFGSAYPTARWIEIYERGFGYERYDLTVRSVADLTSATRLLARLGMRYVVPEDEGGTVWVIPRRYTEKHIRRTLDQLPCTFTDQGFRYRVEVFDEIDASGCCTYDVREHRKSR